MQPLTPEPQGAGLGAPPFLGVLSRHFSDRVVVRVRSVTRAPSSSDDSSKGRAVGADSVCMMISEEQARQAAKQLRSQTRDRTPQRARDVSQHVIDEAVVRASRAPETRDDRITAARRHLESGEFDAHAIAEKMLQRIVSDALR